MSRSDVYCSRWAARLAIGLSAYAVSVRAKDRKQLRLEIQRSALLKLRGELVVAEPLKVADSH